MGQSEANERIQEKHSSANEQTWRRTGLPLTILLTNGITILGIDRKKDFCRRGDERIHFYHDDDDDLNEIHSFELLTKEKIETICNDVALFLLLLSLREGLEIDDDD